MKNMYLDEARDRRERRELIKAVVLYLCVVSFLLWSFVSLSEMDDEPYYPVTIEGGK